MNRFRDHHPAFLRRLREGARERAVRRRRPLRRRDWNRSRHFDSQALWSTGLALMTVLAMGRGGGGRVELGQDAVEAGYAISALFLVASLERGLTAALHFWPDLLAALRLPTTDLWMGQRQWGRGLGRILPVVLAAFLGGLTVCLLADSGWAGAAGALLFAGVLSVVVLAAATWLAGTGKGTQFSAVLWFLGIGLWAGVQFLPELRAWAVSALNGSAEWWVLLLPTGWVIRPFHRWLTGGDWHEWIRLLPAVVLVASLPNAVHRLLARARIRDHALLVYGAQVPDDADDAFREAVEAELNRPAPRPLGELRGAVESRLFLAPDAEPLPGHWIERLLWRIWTPRERLLAEVAFGPLPAWSKSYHTASLVFALLIALAALGVHWQIAWLQWSWLAAVAPLVLVLTPVEPALGIWAQCPVLGQVSFQATALFPVGFAEVGRWALKSTRLRLLLGAPLGVLGGASFGLLRPDLVSPSLGAAGVAVALVAVVGFQPLWMTGCLLGHRWPSYVGSGRWHRHLVWTFLGVIWLFLAVVSVVVTFVGDPLLGSILAALAALTGEVGFRWFCRQVGRGTVERVVSAPADASE